MVGALHGTMQLIALWLSGPGLRLLACLTLRVKDLDYERSEIRMREAGVARTG